MRTGVVASAIAHAALIAFGLLSLGAAEPLLPDAIDSISVDLVPVSDFSNIRVGTLDSEIVETDTPSAVKDDAPAELAQPTGNTETDQPRPTEADNPSPAPTMNTAPEPPPPTPQPEPAPTPEPAPAPEPTPAQPEPEPAPVPDPTPVAPTPELAVAPTPEAPKEVVPQPVVRTAALEQKRAQYKKEQEDAKKKAADDAKKAEDAKKQAALDVKKAADEKKKKDAAAKAAEEAKHADQVANIINNEDSRGATTGAGGEPTLGKPTGQSATLSQSEIDALVAQIRTCLVMPAGAEEAGATTKLQFSLDGSGGVVGQPQITQSAGSPIEDAYARAAMRAVMRCGPYGMAKGQDVSALFSANTF